MGSHLSDEQIEEHLRSACNRIENSSSGRRNEDEVRAHIQLCEICQARVQEHKDAMGRFALLKPVIPGAPTAQCPSDDVWIAISAGLTTGDTESHLSHAAHCDHCGPLLREAISELTQDLSPEEITTIESLPSASSEWQKNLAIRLSKSGPLRKGEERPSPRLRLFLPLAFAVSLIGLVSSGIWWKFNQSQSKPPAELIAEAYSQRRTLPFRFPGAHYSPLRVTRGGESSGSERPLSLLQAELQIAKHGQHNKLAGDWLLASAYSNLLEGNYEQAVQLLGMSANEPSSTPAVDLALATAYYQRGIQNHTADDLGKAREAIGRAIDKDPYNPIALYNRALIDEGMGLYLNAISDWEQYLAVDSSGEWSSEAKEHLSNCRTLKQRKEKATNDSALFSSEEIAGSGPLTISDSALDRRIEDYQLRVFTIYYPSLTDGNHLSNTSHKAIERQAIERLGRLSASEHNDHLLLDLLTLSNSPESRVPAQELKSAITANRNGDEEIALRSAHNAFTHFLRIGNWAGSLRAEFEMIYAMQFMSRVNDCVTEGRQLAAKAHGRRYSWLAAEAEIEVAFCGDMNGDLDEAFRYLRRAERDAEQARYESALDRALVGEESMQWQVASKTTSWDVALSGLKHFWATTVPYERGESFCDVLDEIAEQNHEWHLQSAFLGESLALLDQGQDPLARAQVMVRLAANQLMLHHVESADSLLSNALVIFRAAPQTAATKNQELMVQINMAKAMAANHDFVASVARLQKMLPEIKELHEDLSLIEFYSTLGESYRKLHNDAKAEQSDIDAIRIFNNSLSSLKRTRDKLTWIRQVSPAFRSLVQLRVDEQRASDALRIWQEYRSVALSPKPKTFVGGSHESRPLPPAQLQTTIVYANLPEGPFAWAISGQTMLPVQIGTSSEDLRQMAEHFSEECSSPTSDLGSLSADGKQLYEILVAPFLSLLPEQGAILIEPDEELARIPFSALVDRHGQFLNSIHTIAISPFQAVGSIRVSRVPPQRDAPALVVESRYSLDGREEDSQAAEEASRVASFFPNSISIRSDSISKSRFLDLLKQAVVFHFSGHSATSGNGGALPLGPRNLTDSQSSALFRSDDFSGIRLTRGRLAVLAACQTDIGSEEHWLDRDNLAITLLTSGFPEVVASHWEVDSGASSALMQAFYKNTGRGISVPDALRYAMEDVRKTGRYQHPYFWAGFSVLEASGAS